MSQKQEAANQKAFERGQSDWREGKSLEDNPYPHDAVAYRDFWQQGWQSEHDIHYK